MDRGYDTRSPIQKKSSLPRTFSLFRTYVFVTLFLFGISLSLVITHAPLFEIRSVVVSGAVITPNENIQSYLAKTLEGDWRVVFPFNSIISIPTKTLEKSIKQAFASVDIVSIDRVGLSQVQVSIVERVPIQTYCKNQACVLIDQNGTVFTVASKPLDLEVIDGNPAEFMRRSSAASTNNLSLGEPLLPTSGRIGLETAGTFLTTQGFVIKKIYLAPLGFFDIEAIHKESQAQVEFRFRDTKKINEQINELYLALEKGLRQKIRDNTVEYVISYVPQKVIYKNTEK